MLSPYETPKDYDVRADMENNSRSIRRHEKLAWGIVGWFALGVIAIVVLVL